MNNASFVGSFTGEGAAGVASLDPPLMQQTKSEIRTLASEIAKLAHGAFEPAEFYRGFLPRLVTAMGAEGAAVWRTIESLRNCGELDSTDDVTNDSTDDARTERSLQLVAQHCLASELLERSSRATEGATEKATVPSDSHRKILECVIAEGTPILVPPQTVSIDADRPANPLEHSIIVIPVRIEEDVEYVLEVVQPASGGPAAQRGYLRFVAQMADLMSDYLRRQSLREHSARAARLQQFEFWLSSIAQAASPSSQLRSVADGLADLLDSYQVFILRSGRGPKVLAASGLETFDPRSETILAAQLAERFLQRESSAREACLDLAEWKSGDGRLSSVSNLYDLLASDRLVRLRLSERGDVIALLALTEASGAAAAEMKRVATSLFGLVDPHAAYADWLKWLWPIRTALAPRAAGQLKRSKLQLWVTRGVLAGLATVIAFFPLPQQISTTAVLAPTEKNCYYAPADATVTFVINAAQNEKIDKGTPLLKLESVALNHRLSGLEGEQATNVNRKEYLTFASSNPKLQGTPEFDKLSSELKQVELKIESNQAEQKLIAAEIAKLNIVALEDGELTTWDVKNRLEGRPVARGDLLLSTCNPETDWQLQVSVPEHRVGLVSDALKRSTQRMVPIRFSLTSHPGVPMEGELTWMADQATRNAAGANVVLSKAAVHGELPLKMEGAIARVTIDCGRVPAIWLVVRDAYWACMSRLRMIW